MYFVSEILVIPDLEEVQEEDMATQIAAPPRYIPTDTLSPKTLYCFKHHCIMPGQFVGVGVVFGCVKDLLQRSVVKIFESPWASRNLPIEMRLTVWY